MEEEEERLPWMTEHPFEIKAIAIDKNRLTTNACDKFLGSDNLTAVLSCIHENNATYPCPCYRS